MRFYDPHDFYSIICTLSGSVLPHATVAALPFAAVGGAAFALENGEYIQQEHNELTLVCGLVMSLLLSFRLNFAFSRYDEAIGILSALESSSRQVVSRMCAYVEPSDDAIQSVMRSRRWLTFILLLVRARLRVGQDLDFALLERIAMVTPLERKLLARPVMKQRTAHLSRRGSWRRQANEDVVGERFPNKARVALIIQLLWSETNQLFRSGELASANHWAAVDSEIGRVGHGFSRLEATLSQLMPFAYAHFIKFVIVLYLLAFPFGVAVSLSWATPLFAWVTATVFLSIDKVGAVMEVRVPSPPDCCCRRLVQITRAAGCTDAVWH
jgi:predicted membrane chloride channel (bestrophin family)